MYLQYFNEKKLQVPKILWVSWHTASFAGWYLLIPSTGTVYMSVGMVWENLTYRLPMLNPIPLPHVSTLISRPPALLRLFIPPLPHPLLQDQV